MQIRPYQPKDLEQTVTLWWEARKKAFTYIKEQYTFDQYTSFFQNVIAAKNQVWVTQLEQSIVGFIAIQDNFIDHLYVTPNYQRQGVGTALLTKAKELSPNGLSLYTFQKNSQGRAFYEKHGFKAVKFGVSPDEGEPDVYYKWK